MRVKAVSQVESASSLLLFLVLVLFMISSVDGFAGSHDASSQSGSQGEEDLSSSSAMSPETRQPRPSGHGSTSLSSGSSTFLSDESSSSGSRGSTSKGSNPHREDSSQEFSSSSSTYLAKSTSSSSGGEGSSRTGPAESQSTAGMASSSTSSMNSPMTTTAPSSSDAASNETPASPLPRPGSGVSEFSISDSSEGTAAPATTAAPPTPVPPLTLPPNNGQTLPPSQRVNILFKVRNTALEPFNEDTFITDICSLPNLVCYPNEVLVSYRKPRQEGQPVELIVDFKGSRAGNLQTTAAAMSLANTPQLRTFGVLEIRPAPAVPATPAPNLLQRSSSMLWVVAAAFVGGVVLFGGLFWFVRDRTRKKRAYEQSVSAYMDQAERAAAAGGTGTPEVEVQLMHMDSQSFVRPSHEDL